MNCRKLILVGFAAMDVIAATAAGRIPLRIPLWEGSPFWADANIGAGSPEDYGLYFWWGDTVGYRREGDVWVASDGSSSNFSFAGGNVPTYRKDIATLQSEGWITVNNTLAPEHDAAHVHLGGNWRMPTEQELMDLVSKCDWTRSIKNGVHGYIVRGRGRFARFSIFLPCAGCGDRTWFIEIPGAALQNGYSDCYSGYYWSATPSRRVDVLYAEALNLAYNWPYYSSNVYGPERCLGFSIRPVQGYTVTFNANGGIGDSTRSVGIGAEVGTLPTPTRSGYSFNGWWTATSGGSKIKISTMVLDNVTYYAQWKANKYKIKFNKNGGKGKMKTQSATYGKSVKLRANAFKKTGCKFKGWAKTKKGKVAYKNKANVKNLTATNGKTVTLYAIWKKAKASSVKSTAATKTATSAAKSSAVVAAVPAWAVGTFYGGDGDALSTITVSKAGKVSGKVLFADGGRWTLVGSASGQRIAAVVTDASGSSTPIGFVITRTVDGRCRIETKDSVIWAEGCKNLNCTTQR